MTVEESEHKFIYNDYGNKWLALKDNKRPTPLCLSNMDTPRFYDTKEEAEQHKDINFNGKVIAVCVMVSIETHPIDSIAVPYSVHYIDGVGVYRWPQKPLK